MSEEPISVMVLVTGRVQGVSYRAWVQRRAAAGGLSGWVRNEPDGTVAAQIEGPQQAVDEMLTAMKSGPPLARVDRLTALPGAVTGAQGFEITD
jgi:acylphosphatase